MATFKGTKADELIIGTEGDDNLIGGGGFDTIRGLGGNDSLSGTGRIEGGDGNDRIDAGSGNDELFGGSGADAIEGGDGNDSVNGGEGNDTLRGERGNDQLSGGAGNDTIEGGDGDDLIEAGAGDDSIDGGVGIDSIFGGGGIDIINGGDGGDTIDAGNGADKINGGVGQDFITTGAGKDVITFDVNLLRTGDTNRSSRQVTAGEDFVTDFTRGSDVIALDAVQFRIFGELKFVNALAADLPSSGVNFIVLQDSDNDNNPATPFNAGSAANLIAEQIDQAGPGFFIYFNSDLQLNRLVYSEDLSDPTADLQVIARFTDELGADAIAALAEFTAADFDLINEELNVKAFPVEVELEAGGQVLFVNEFADAASVGVDREAAFNPGRGPVVTFDPTSDVVQIDQALIALDKFVDSSGFATPAQGGREDTFFKFTSSTTDLQFANSIANGSGAKSGIALYYDKGDDTVNVALIKALNSDAFIFDADVIVEFEVNGEAEGLALIAALTPANFQIVSPPDLDPNAVPVNDAAALSTASSSDFIFG